MRLHYIDQGISIVGMKKGLRELGHHMTNGRIIRITFIYTDLVSGKKLLY